MANSNYEELTNLVEEVRGLMNDLTEAPAKDDGEGDVKGKFKKGTAHNPFRWVKKGKAIGPGPRGRTNRKAGYWSCRCAGYRCLCKGSEGERKRVIIDRAYKGRYNTLYRKWRAKHKSRFTPGKTFVARPKAAAAGK